MIAAAFSGEEKIAISGTVRTPTPPENPLFDIPVIKTAGTATAKNQGSMSNIA